MKFVKMHGVGNDFVILDQRDGALPLPHSLIRHLCNRQKGVGCDQLIIMEPSDKADVFMRIYNPDGSQSEACGNATRCVADLAGAKTIETLAGILKARKLDDGLIEVDMGVPKLGWQDIPMSEPTDTLHLHIGDGFVRDPVAVSMGNPHCVFFVSDVEQVNIELLGPHYENYPIFPERTNVEFVQVLDNERVRLRTWERGAGLTLACGSAACATVVAAVRRDLTDRKISVITDGGTLYLEWRETDDHVLMTGPVAYVFEGVLKEQF